MSSHVQPPFHAAAALPPPATLDDCAREPIHTPGAIQPHGGLLAFDPASGVVLHASANLGRWLALDQLQVCGLAAADLLGDDAVALILHALPGTLGGSARHQVVDLPERPEVGQAALEATVHLQQGICIVEIDHAAAPARQHDWTQLFVETIDALRGAEDTADLIERTSQRVKRLTGFDRVMVYRFDDAWNGHVLADAHEPGMESFLDLHYPASDIPAQARELYRSNLVRYIADVGYEPVPLLSWSRDGTPQALDMSHAVLRSISPMHIRYLQNMGVASTLVMSLLVDGKLWGLIACHHRVATALPVRLRHACHTLAVSAGFMVGWHEQGEQAATRAVALQARDRIVDAFNQPQAPLADVVEHSSGALLRIGSATGGAYWRGELMLPFGQWPGGARGESVLRYLRHAFDTSHEAVLCTEQAPLVPPLEATELRTVCGLMAIKLDDVVSSGIVWVRPEYRREVAWGGDPDKPVEMGTDASGRPALSPRTSFAIWSTLVQGHCRPWTELDRDAARSLLMLRQVITVRDSLAQARLGESQFHSLVALQSDSYWQIDRAGCIITLSKPLPGGHGAVDGQTLPALFTPYCLADDVEALRLALAAGKPLRGLRMRGRADAAAAFTLVLNGEPIKDREQHVTGWHGTLTEATLEVAMQTALRDKEVAELASQAKSRFLSQISHELRTPLNAVLGFSQLLLGDTTLPEAQRRKLQHIRKAGEWLLAMISDLLDLSRIESGQLSIQLVPVDARAALEECIGLLGPQAAADHLHLILEDGASPLWVSADVTRLRQLLGNLAGNALKYNNPNGEVRFSAHADAAGGRVRIEVRDTGMGLTAEQIAQLFQPFNRLGRENQRIQGAGIGLVISKQIVEAMGGQISVHSEPGKGSCFAIELAAAEAPAKPPA